MPKPNLIICTDLDGTLLDHHNYSFDRARQALDLIRKIRIPLLLNTSKTAAEVKEIRARLNIDHPSIVENGAGLIIPENYFPSIGATSLPEKNGYQFKSFGSDLQQVIDCLQQVREQYAYKFRGFSEMPIGEIAELTGLTPENAQQAKNRLFSEPILWHDTEQTRQQFIQIMQDLKLQVVRGGRFSHVSGGGCKRQALLWLKKHYAKLWQQTPKVIALGDGENDIGMLQIADIAVLVRSPVNPLPSLPNHKRLYVTEQEGPAGWNQTILELLNQ